jgi:hypothetical protein
MTREKEKSQTQTDATSSEKDLQKAKFVLRFTKSEQDSSLESISVDLERAAY